MTNTSSYKHSPLSSPDTFRLVDILPSPNFNVPVSCEIGEIGEIGEVGPLSEEESTLDYEALS